MKHPGKFTRHALAIAIALAMPMTASADAAYDALKKQVEQMQKQLEQMQEALKKQETKVQAVEENTVTRAEGKALETAVNEASEWKDPNTLVHMSGFADVGYVDGDNQDGSFVVGNFSPIFHFQYKDMFMLESEIEFEVEDNGDTNVALEYMTIDWFVNDYVALVGGKFLSPIGQFRQNLHPSWINKMASAPPGFGHGGAAPTSETGLQARGGFPIGKIRTNYSFYVGNGPELDAEADGSGGFTLDGISAEGKGADRDGEKVWGARFAILPIPELEIGISAATGKATVTAVHDSTAPVDLSNEQARDYDVLGFDAAWHYRALTVRGEYIKSEVGSATTGNTAGAPDSEWSTWYTQGSYQIPRTRLEGVVRYADFDSQNDAQDQEQWALGMNYLFANNVIAKITYEINDGQTGERSDDDKWYFQLAYGF